MACYCKLDIAGQTFGRLTAVVPTEMRDKQERVMWSCSCLCGGFYLASASDLRRGRTRSCGCLRGAVSLGKPKPRHRNKSPVCVAHGCAESPVEKGRFCSTHSRRVDRHGSPDIVILTDERLARSRDGWARRKAAA